MKKLLLLLALCANSYAADSSFAIAANTPNNVGSSNHWVITKFAFTAGGSAAVVNLYDTGSPATTNVTTGAYTSTISFMTNITQITTNTTGTLLTNTFRGMWSVETPVAGGTSEAQKMLVLSVPANTRQERVVNLTTIKGLTIWSSTAGTAEVQFRPLY